MQIIGLTDFTQLVFRPRSFVRPSRRNRRYYSLVPPWRAFFVGEVAISLDYPETWHLYRTEPRMYLGFTQHCGEIAMEDALAGDTSCSAPAKDRRTTALMSRPMAG